jgi:hypothetical protein
MAGYSGTPLFKKLGIKPGGRLAVISAPDGFAIADLPDGIVAATTLRGKADVIVCFVTATSDLEKRFPKLKAALDPAGGLWIAWPKRTAGVKTDLSENPIRAIGLGAGLVDNKVCAIDETWSGLRFVVRLADRPR